MQVSGMAPWPVELGGEFVHGADSVLAELIKQLNIPVTERAWPDYWCALRRAGGISASGMTLDSLQTFWSGRQD